jgi:diaminobutyrate-2-oxoglutarate transaminase
VNEYEFLRGVESNARTYAATFEHLLVSGHGVRVEDSRGHQVIDCLACAGALPLGHNHPEVRESVLRFLSSGQLQQALDLSTPAKYEFVRELFSLLPPELSKKAKIQFCSPSGSDAVEAAMKLARFATGRHGVIAFHGAYHGMTTGALSAMGNLTPKLGIGLASNGIHFAPFPNRRHCPFGSSGAESDQLSLNYLRTILTDPESGIAKPAAVIVEVVQGEGGCIPASASWLRGLRELTSQLGVVLIVDEVQTGLGRTGQMFGFQQADIVPDVVVLSKAIGGGHPLAVVVYDEALDSWPRGMHAGTFRGNQIAMVAGEATMKIVRRDGLDTHAHRMGELLCAGLNQLRARYPWLSDVRGRGLMLGVELSLAGPGGKRCPEDGELARRIKGAAYEAGLMIETGGRFGAVLRFLPPLILREQDVGQIVDRLDSALSTVLKQNAVHAA